MRVLHLTDLYAPMIGGLEQHVQTLAGALARRGNDVAVATIRIDGSPRFELADGVRIHRIGSLSQRLHVHSDPRQPFHPTFPDPGVMAGLRRVIADERPEIVHAHSWIVYSFLPLKARSRARLVVTAHTFSLVCPKQIYVHRGYPCGGPAYGKCVRCASEQLGWAKSLVATTGLRLSRPLHGHVDTCVAVSSAVAQVIEAHGGLLAPIEVLPNFNPDDVLGEVARTPRPAFLPAEDGYLLFVGALGPHKGLDVLFEAYAGMAERVPLVVIGTPRPDTPRVVPDGVIVVRDVPHAQVMRAYAHCGVAVVPSRWPEAFGIVAIEAMACGRPVVASAVGGLSDTVVDGETGLLVPYGNVPALRDALASLIADPVRRARMGEAARRRAERFTASAVVGRIEALYAELLAKERAGR